LDEPSLQTKFHEFLECTVIVHFLHTTHPTAKKMATEEEINREGARGQGG
jgi:hypothetical protein